MEIEKSREYQPDVRCSSVYLKAVECVDLLGDVAVTSAPKEACEEGNQKFEKTVTYAPRIERMDQERRETRSMM